MTFLLQRKLPYKKMLIVTGRAASAFVLVVMVGQTARTMQGTGWLPITPIDIDVPVLGRARGSASSRRGRRSARRSRRSAFVIGSYYGAEYVRIKKPQKAAAKRRAAAEAAQPVPAAEPEPERVA